MSGTANQVEWAQRIRCRVNDEFDRVTRAFRFVAAKQSDVRRAGTEAILGILEEKRAAVMSRQELQATSLRIGRRSAIRCGR